MNRYISDLHFGHTNIIAFDNRPYKNAEEMDAALIENWNSAVGKHDTVFILGDFCWKNASEWKKILQQLVGNKVLIRGNHDLGKMPTDLKAMFQDIKDYKEIDDNGKRLVLSHYPIPFFKNMYYGWLHLYGHVHTTTEGNMANHFFRTIEDYYGWPQIAFNVSCMLPYMDYTPRTLDEILIANGRN